MINKLILFMLLVFLLIGCSSKTNSDGSDATTYSSCSITSSNAIFASDRAMDVSQCWDGVNYEEKSLALDWCKKKITAYMGARYLIGHSYEYKVSSTNCPKK